MTYQYLSLCYFSVNVSNLHSGILRDSYLSQIEPSTGISSLGSLARYLRMDSGMQTPLAKQRNRTVSQPCLMPSSTFGFFHDPSLIPPSSQIVVSQLQSELLNADAINVLHPPRLQYSPGLCNKFDWYYE